MGLAGIKSSMAFGSNARTLSDAYVPGHDGLPMICRWSADIGRRRRRRERRHAPGTDRTARW
jgi:hypothetical protein